MNTGDARFIKSLNRRILIEKIIENRAISRSDLARLTGLNKSTVSAQIYQMLDEQLVTEKTSEFSSGGRKPILLQMNEEAGFTVGIDIEEPVIQIQVTNLLGKPVKSYTLPNEHLTAEQTINNLLKKLRTIVAEMEKRYTPVGLTGIGTGVHGIVNNKDKVVFTPKEKWVNIDLKKEIEATFKVPVYIVNNADLCVYAEQVYNYHLPDLFNLTMYSGIGLGILQDNKIYRGFQGFAGEIGHMIIEKEGLPCPCGNHGCWELYASDRAIKERLELEGIKVGNSEEVDLELLMEQDPELMCQFLDYFSIGLNNIINIFNPEMIIINSPLLNRHHSLIQHLTERLTSRMSYYEKIVTSTLDRKACSLGGAALALKNYYGVNNLNFNAYEYFGETASIPE